MRYRLMFCFAAALFGAAACQPDPAITQNGGLVGESTRNPDGVPTLFLPPTNTPVIVPTAAPTSIPRQVPTEVAAIPIATAQNDNIIVTPTSPPSKTPSITPTQTAIPSTTPTPTITVTATVTATSEQFAFRGQGQSSAAEATAYALNFQQQQARAAEADQQQQVSTGNAFVPSGGFGAPPDNVQISPGSSCTGEPWFFADIAAPTCPVSTVDSTNAAFQRFQYGYMFWLQDNDQIYAIYNTFQSPRWTQHQNVWRDGMPDCQGEDAVNYANVQAWSPIQGFCMIWTQDDRVAERIGYAEDRYEFSYIARYQFGADNSIAIEDNVGSVFYLGPNGTWDLWRPGG